MLYALVVLMTAVPGVNFSVPVLNTDLRFTKQADCAAAAKAMNENLQAKTSGFAGGVFCVPLTEKAAAKR